MHHDLAQAFMDDQIVQGRDGEVALHRQYIGDLIATSGRIVASDPTWLEQAPPPFHLPLAPGQYPVILSIARFSDGRDTRSCLHLLCANVRR